MSWTLYKDLVLDTLKSKNLLGTDSNGKVIANTTTYLTSLSGITKCWDFVIMNPNSIYTVDAKVFVAIAPAALTITKLQVSCDANPATEITGDLKYADDFISLANAVVINDFDTTDGVRVDTSITSGAVASGKCIYLLFDAEPIAAIKQIHFHIEFDLD